MELPAGTQNGLQHDIHKRSMKIIIAYPVPLDAWTKFHPFVRRFCDTFRQFDTGFVDYKLVAACCGGTSNDEVKNLFHDINTLFVDYPDNGCDIGSAQWIAKNTSQFFGQHSDWNNAWIICMTSRCYFFRAAWLKRYSEAFLAKGENDLYGASASWEGGKAHICTRAYALHCSRFWHYPHLIDTRAKGQKFEVGEWCITEWFRKQNSGCWQITWEGEQEQSDWRKPENIFRKGDQTNMLVWDRHTDYYRDASEDEKQKLVSWVNPPVDNVQTP